MKHRFFLFALWLLVTASFMSCAFFMGNQKQMTQDDLDAWLVLRKGNSLTAQNQLQVAETMLLDSYKKFTMIDNRIGKLKALRGLAKVYSFQSDSVKLNQAYEKMRYLSVDDFSCGREYVLARTEEFYRNGEMDSVISWNRKLENTIDNESDLLAFIYKLNAKIKMRMDYSSDLKLLTTGLKSIVADDPNNMEDPLISGFGYYTLSLASMYKNEIDAAEKYLYQAFDYDRQLSNSRGLADDYILQSDIRKKSGDMLTAYTAMLQAAEIFEFLKLDYESQDCRIGAFELKGRNYSVLDLEILKKIAQETTFPDIKARILGILRNN